MSAAVLPPLDINDLNFDTSERLRHLDWLLAQLGLEHGARVLDVGGYPGYMARAFPHWDVVTVDTYAKGHPPYIKGSGAALPFRDRAFDATIACDVLEHVPPQYRESFLVELARVTDSAVVVAGPYNTPGAASAEKLVRELLPASSPAQAWLAEHNECGLPSLTASLRALGTSAAGTGIVAAGSLTVWVLFFAAQAAGEEKQQVGAEFKDFVTRHNSLIGRNVSDHGLTSSGPAYRHALVGAMDAQTALKLSALSPAANMILDNHEEVEQYVKSMGGLLHSLRVSSSSARSAEETPELTRLYVERLEAMLADRGIVMPSLHSTPAQHVPLSLTDRLKQAARVLLGRC